MGRAKTPESTDGFKSGCTDYSPCPLCYGCRNYDPSYYKCVTTCRGTRKNTCNTQKHNDKALSLMIKPNTVNL